IELIDNPSQLAENHIPSIEKILGDYPFFQSGHLLYAKALQNSKHINYHNALKRTAVIAGNRAVLYRLINQAAPQPIAAIEDVHEAIVIPIKEIVVEEIKVKVKEPEIILEEKTEKIVSPPINYVYTIVKSKEEIVSSKQLAVNNEQIEKQEIPDEIQPTTDNIQSETLNEIILNPIVEAYIETEILKLNEKEPEIKIEEPQSFTQWLKQMPVISKQLAVGNKESRIKSQEPKKAQNPKIKTEKQEFLDKLLTEELRISKPQPEKNFYAATQKTRSSVLEDENLVTETLAKIYVLQGNHPKAIRSYEILSLKFPEKSAYFATLIKELKNNIK
ncbi:MAG: hypothetical protein ABI448_05015, partial [Bacteroidia bacterium]